MKEDTWKINRKQFLNSIILSGIALKSPWLLSCDSKKSYAIPEKVTPLSKEQFKDLQHVLMHLFPEDDNGPSALQVNADKYILWVINDSFLDEWDRNYLIKKIEKFELSCLENYALQFHLLTTKQQNDCINKIASLKWGERFLSRLLTLIFEALLLDPVYGGNPEKIGWNWLEHNPGTPRTPKEIIYPKILKKKNGI